MLQSSAWGAPHVGGWAIGCQEELEMWKGRLDIQPLYHVQQYQLRLLDIVWKWLGPRGPREPPATLDPITGHPGAHWLTHGQHCCPWADPCLCVSTDLGVHLDLDGKTSSSGMVLEFPDALVDPQGCGCWVVPDSLSFGSLWELLPPL